MIFHVYFFHINAIYFQQKTTTPTNSTIYLAKDFQRKTNLKCYN